MIDIRETLGHRVGPLPAYAWGIVVIGGYVGFRALSGHGGGSSAVGGASAPLADLGATGGGSSGDSVTATPLHDIGTPGTYSGSPIDAYQTAVYAYVNGLGNDPGTYSQWAQSVITQSGGTLQHTPVPSAPGNPPPVVAPPSGNPPASATVTFRSLSSGAVATLKSSDAPLSAHQLHLIHLHMPVALTRHQAHLLHIASSLVKR